MKPEAAIGGSSQVLLTSAGRTAAFCGCSFCPHLTTQNCKDKYNRTQSLVSLLAIFNNSFLMASEIMQPAFCWLLLLFR